MEKLKRIRLPLLNEIEGNFVFEKVESVNRKFALQSQIDTKRPRGENTGMSFTAELAFCKHFNLYPRLLMQFDDYYDLTLPDGARVDVKYSNGVHSRFLVSGTTDFDHCDLFAFCRLGEDGHIHIHGFIESDFFKDRPKVAVYNNGYAINESQLKTLEECEVTHLRA